MITTSTAIFALFPKARFTMNAEDYDQIIWHSDDITKPTLSEINAKITELEAAEPMRLLREERDRRLGQTDWRDLPSYPGTDQDEWRTYRQALRDLPSTAEPQLDENGQLTNVTWPTKPE